MKEFVDSESPQPRNTGPTLLIILAATMLGSCLAIVISEQDAFFNLKNKTMRLVSANSDLLPVGIRAEIFRVNGSDSTESEEAAGPKIFSTEPWSLGDIRYSPQSDSAQLVIDLQEAVLVRAKKLSAPDRIYFDLQDNSRKETPRKPGSQKTLNIEDALLHSVRIADKDTGTMRIVLDLTRACDFTYQIPDGSPSRLVVRIRPL